jgi:hypothetical protein
MCGVDCGSIHNKMPYSVGMTYVSARCIYRMITLLDTPRKPTNKAKLNFEDILISNFFIIDKDFRCITNYIVLASPYYSSF